MFCDSSSGNALTVDLYLLSATLHSLSVLAVSDPAHIPFAHHSLQGTREDGSPLAMTVLANNFTYVECTFGDKCRGKTRDGVVAFQRPAFFHYRTRLNATSAYTPNLLIFATPVEAGKCRIMMPDFPVKFFPKWLMHVGSNRFLNTDTWLHNAERVARSNTAVSPYNRRHGAVGVGAARVSRRASEGLNYLVATQSDLGPTAFRRWWSKHGFAEAPQNTFGAAEAAALPSRALGRAEQIDPWLHHARDCAQCRGALRKMRLLQQLGTAGAAMGAILLRNKPPLAMALVLAGVWGHHFLRKFATTIEGNTHRAEIEGRSVSALK